MSDILKKKLSDILKKKLSLKEIQKIFFEKINWFDEIIKSHIALRDYEKAERQIQIAKELMEVWCEIFNTKNEKRKS